MGTISHLPRRDRPQPAFLRSEQEAEAALDALLDDWQAQAGSLARRREALKLSGLGAISLSADVGGLDCSTALLALLVRRIEAVDTHAAEALHRHFVLVDAFRESGDDRFYAQLAEQSLAGDLLMGEENPDRGLLSVTQEDFQTTASGSFLLPESALFADWLWLPALNDAAGHRLEGAALVPVRAATFESRTDAAGKPYLAARFREAPVAHGLWGRRAREGQTARALDHLLEAARASVPPVIDPESAKEADAVIRAGLHRRALLALIGEAAAALDRAQVAPDADSLAHASHLCRDAALLSADIQGNRTRFGQLVQQAAP